MDSPRRTGPRAGRRAAAYALAIALLALCAVAAPTPPTGGDPRAAAAQGPQPGQRDGGVVVRRQFRYAYGDRAVLDVYRARATRASGAAAVLVVHGGGWRSGHRRRMAGVSRALAQAGLVAFNVGYSLATPWHPGFPTQLRELRAALRWVRRNAERFGVDPRRIGALGSSAGGHLASLLALARRPGTRPLVRAVVSWSAPFDLSRSEVAVLAPAIREFLGCEPGECSRTRAAASPLTHVTADDPPMLIVSSEGDFVPVEQAEELAARLAAVGVPRRLWVLPGAAHGTAYAPVALAPSVAFLRRRL